MSMYVESCPFFSFFFFSFFLLSRQLSCMFSMPERVSYQLEQRKIAGSIARSTVE